MNSFLKHIESFWRHTILYPFLRTVLHNPPYGGTVDIKSVRKILILRFDRIGDMIVTTPIFSFFKKHYPHITVGVVASTANAELLRHNKDVDKVYILSANWLRNLREMRQIRNEHYDVVLNFIFNRTSTVGLFSYCVARNALKVGQGFEKHRFYFNKFLQLPRNSQHMTEVLARYINEVFGVSIPENELEYSIPLSEDCLNSVENFLHTFFNRTAAGRYHCVAVNLSAVDSERRISTEQAHRIMKELHTLAVPVVTIRGPQDKEMDTFAKTLEKEGLCRVFPYNRAATLLELAALVSKVGGVITPDTSLVHFAAAMKTPVLAFYTEKQDWREWQPWRVRHISVVAKNSEPVGAISQEEILSALRQFVTLIFRYEHGV